MTPASPPRRASRRRLVPRNLLSYDERRQLAAGIEAPTKCARPGCDDEVQAGSVCCSRHANDLAQLKVELEEPWDWKEGRRGVRRRSSTTPKR